MPDTRIGEYIAPGECIGTTASWPGVETTTELRNQSHLALMARSSTNETHLAIMQSAESRLAEECRVRAFDEIRRGI